MSAQLDLYAVSAIAETAALSKAPSVAELKEAIQGAWIGVQLYCSRERFRWGILRWHRKAIIVREWRRMQRICLDNAARYPHLNEYSKRAADYAAQRAWLAAHDLPQEVVDYDPTELLHGIEYNWCPRSEPDALDRIALENMFSVEDRIGKDRLREAGWIVDDVEASP